MRFMMLVIPKGYESAQPDAMPDADAVAKMMKYNEDLAKAGVLLSLDGLQAAVGRRARQLSPAASRRSPTVRSRKRRNASAATG